MPCGPEWVVGREAGCSDGSWGEAGGWDAHEGGTAGPTLPKAQVLADPQEPSLRIRAIRTGQGAPKGRCRPGGTGRPDSRGPGGLLGPRLPVREDEQPDGSQPGAAVRPVRAAPRWPRPKRGWPLRDPFQSAPALAPA